MATVAPIENGQCGSGTRNAAGIRLVPQNVGMSTSSHTGKSPGGRRRLVSRPSQVWHNEASASWEARKETTGHPIFCRESRPRGCDCSLDETMREAPDSTGSGYGRSRAAHWQCNSDSAGTVGLDDTRANGLNVLVA